MKRVDDFNDIGVIVGRFQVDDLHEGHVELINYVVNQCKRTIVFLGLSYLKCTKNNPLDLVSRKHMILEKFPNIDVFYIDDDPCDYAWSKKLDGEISKHVAPGSKIALYGSRDAFISHYHGRHPTIELQQEVYVSGTSIRKNISLNNLKCKEFRAGAIWAIGNQYNNPIPTVDICIFDASETKILLGRKKNQQKHRFIGGHVDCKETAEIAAARETLEETSLDIGGVNNLKFLGTYVINDWRYRGEKNNILTLFYSTKALFGSPMPNDDIDELKWFDIKKLPYEDIIRWEDRLSSLVVSEHEILIRALFQKVLIHNTKIQPTIDDVVKD